MLKGSTWHDLGEAIGHNQKICKWVHGKQFIEPVALVETKDYKTRTSSHFPDARWIVFHSTGFFHLDDDKKINEMPEVEPPKWFKEKFPNPFPETH